MVTKGSQIDFNMGHLSLILYLVSSPITSLHSNAIKLTLIPPIHWYHYGVYDVIH